MYKEIINFKEEDKTELPDMSLEELQEISLLSMSARPKSYINEVYKKLQEMEPLYKSCPSSTYEFEGQTY